MERCPTCGTQALSPGRFCAACGGAIQAAATPGERRHITFLFADLVGSVRMVEERDPEELLDTMAAYHRAIVETVERFHGHVAHIAGDGVMACFGYPAGSEDGPLRAVHAGRAIVGAVRLLEIQGAHPGGSGLAVRVGVATGTVVTAPNTGLGRVGETSFIGAAPNIASRLQNYAGANEVLIAASTQRIVADAFISRPVGPFVLKGFAQPVPAHVVTDVAMDGSRLERRLSRTRTPLVNRRQELSALLARWLPASQGATQVMVVVGDAGVGKSRLFQAFHEMLEERGPHRRFTLQCSAMLSNTALHPHIAHLQSLAGFDARDEPLLRLQRLRALLEASGLDGLEPLALLAALLTIPTDGILPPLEMSPLLQRQQTFAVLIRLWRHAGQRAPLLVVYEDLHWLDPASAALLEQIVTELRDTRMLLVCTTRPGTTPPWIGAAHVGTLPLAQLTAAHAGEMVATLAAESLLPPVAFQRIVSKAGGVPLYLEELTRMMLDAPAGSDGAVDMPETLLDLLTERLDQLGPARALARVGAAIGASFSVELAAEAGGIAPDALSRQLQTLFESGLAQPGPAADTVAFKHALVRDAAYETILLRDRRDLHGRIAAAIVARLPAVAETEPEAVARHLTYACQPFDAAAWWLRAGQQAISRGAPRAAVAHFEAGLAALATLPDDERRMRAELALLAGLGPAQMIMQGPGHADFGAVQRRAFETTRRLPDAPSRFPITYGLALFHWGRAELAPAETLARDLLDMAAAAPEPEHVMAANTMTAMLRFHRGAPVEAQQLLTQSTRLYDPGVHAVLYPRYMMDFGVFGRFYLALSSFVAGDPAASALHAGAAWDLAGRLQQPHSRGFAMLANFIVAAFRRDPAEALAWAGPCSEFAGTQGFPEFVALSLIVRGWALGEAGDPAQGLLLLEQGFALWKATGFENWQSWFGVLRADLLLALGRPAEALAEIAEQERRTTRNREGGFRSLLASAHARALAAAGGAEVETWHRRALAIAAAQGARSWELRCTVAYAHWLTSGRRGAEAEALLRGHLVQFAPSALTSDLREAQGMLAAAEMVEAA